MPSLSIKLKDPIKGERFPLRGPVGWRVLGAILKKWREGIRLEVSVDGGNLQSIDGGFHLELDGGGGVDGAREIDVCFGGAPAKRMVSCSQAYHYVDGEKVYLE